MFRRTFAAALLIASAVLGVGAVPVGAAQPYQIRPANCNHIYDTNKTTLVAKSPKMWHESGYSSQGVRYRINIYRWNGSSYVYKATGAWHTGTASGNNAASLTNATANLSVGYGAGTYRIAIGMRWKHGNSWGSHASAWVGTYYQNWYYSGAWHFKDTYNYCQA